MLRINKNKLLLLLLILFILLGCFYLYGDNAEGYIPRDGFVPDQETAKKIAEVVLYPIYGRSIKYQKPFKVTLIENKIWVVEGTLSKNTVGGVFHIEMQKENCTILNVSHGK
jgi:hypothetical protein